MASGIETETRFSRIVGIDGMFGPIPETAIASAPMDIAMCFISSFRNLIVLGFEHVFRKS